MPFITRKTNTQDEARLDVAAVGLYAPFERTFFDIRVTHPNCDTNTFKTLDKIYKFFVCFETPRWRLACAAIY